MFPQQHNETRDVYQNIEGRKVKVKTIYFCQLCGEINLTWQILDALKQNRFSSVEEAKEHLLAELRSKHLHHLPVKETGATFVMKAAA